MQEDRNHRELIWEKGIRWLGRQLRQDRVPVTVSALVGILCYMFMLTNKLPNHDDAFTLFFKGGTWSLGRWGLGTLDLIFPNYSMPWINGVLAITLMTASVCVILRTFRIRNKLLQGLLAASVIAFPSLIATMAYMFTVAPYALAFLLAVGAVRLMEQGGRRDCLTALALMIGSLSIYQSYVAVTASLLVLLLIQDLLEGEETAKVIRRGVGYVLFLIASLGIYYGATMILNRLRGVSFNGYASGNLSFDFVSIPSDILLAYQSFFRFFSEGFHGLMPTPLSRVLHLGMGLCVLLLIAFRCLGQKKPDAGRYLLLAVLLALLPLTINCMYLFTVPDAVHTLVLYSFTALYVLAALAAELCLSEMDALAQRTALHGLTLAMALAVGINIYTANEASLNMQLRYENACAFYSSLASDLKNHPEFTEGSKIAVIGDWHSPDFYGEHFGFTNDLTGTVGFLPSDYSKERFLQYYIGLDLPFASDEETAAIAAAPEFSEMAVYPYYGSVAMIGDTLVVRLS